ncbi:MAG: hypothetical protein ABFC89_05675, partial [Methanospirillum sp.]
SGSYPTIGCFGVTADINGASLYLPRWKTVYSVPAEPVKNPVSEIGCGDVFDAFFVGCLMNKERILHDCGVSEEEFYQLSLRLSNSAAGIKMGELASEIVTIEQVIKDLEHPPI